MQKRFAGRRRFNGGARPSRAWADVSQQFVFAAVSATSTATLIQLQAPASLASLTSDPPEDMTLMRIRGSFSVSLSATIAQNWTLALVVQDVTWTPGATFTIDADKRILWHRSFATLLSLTHSWTVPGNLYLDPGGGAQALIYQGGYTDLDIAPRVKVEAGRALLLVAYENTATAGTCTVSSQDMRVLFQRSGRPR